MKLSSMCLSPLSPSRFPSLPWSSLPPLPHLVSSNHAVVLAYHPLYRCHPPLHNRRCPPLLPSTHAAALPSSSPLAQASLPPLPSPSLQGCCHPLISCRWTPLLPSLPLPSLLRCRLPSSTRCDARGAVSQPRRPRNSLAGVEQGRWRTRTVVAASWCGGLFFIFYSLLFPKKSMTSGCTSGGNGSTHHRPPKSKRSRNRR
jgi:hypothetical protein